MSRNRLFGIFLLVFAALANAQPVPVTGNTVNQGKGNDAGSPWNVFIVNPTPGAVPDGGTMAFQGPGHDGGAWEVYVINSPPGAVPDGGVTAYQGTNSTDGGSAWNVYVVNSSGSTATQGPGHDGGAWEVYVINQTVTVASDGGGVTAYQGGNWSWPYKPCTCAESSMSKISLVATVARRVPLDGGVSNRTYIILNNRGNNTGNFMCRSDGVIPVFSTTTEGDYLAPTDRVIYSVPDLLLDGGPRVNCISDQGGGSSLSTYECVCL